MKEFFDKYITLRKHNASVAIKKMKRSKMCYLFLAPYAIIFTLFYVAPVAVSIFFSFTYYNILESPRFLGLDNYISLVLEDDIFLTSIKNTLLIAVVTGPLGYIASFLFAWLINELPRWVRSVAVIIFYAPSIAGAACLSIFSVFFRGDAYGQVNAFLMNLGIIDTIKSNPEGKIAVLGLAFKGGTDDCRESPAIDIVKEMIKHSHNICVYDPKAMNNAKTILGDSIEYAASIEDACNGADVMVILTEWEDFRHIDLLKIKSIMAKPEIVDLRNMLNVDDVVKAGFEYQGVGK